MINVAIIVSGGIGNRFGANVPKQFQKINDKPILQHTIEKFNANNNIHEIVIVSKYDFIEDTKNIIKNLQCNKTIRIVEGGKERFNSVYNGLKFIADEIKNVSNVLIHDAVRPFLSQEILNNVIASLKSNNAVSVVMPVTDTVYYRDNKNTEILDRNLLFTAQTPQAFDFNLILKAYQLIIDNISFKPTDDVSVLLNYDKDIKIDLVKGSIENKKITFKEDLTT